MKITTESFDYEVFCRASQMTLASDSAQSLQEAFDICDAIAKADTIGRIDCFVQHTKYLSDVAGTTDENTEWLINDSYSKNDPHAEWQKESP